MLSQHVGKRLVAHGQIELLPKYPSVVFDDLLQLTAFNQNVPQLRIEDKDFQSPQEIETFGDELQSLKMVSRIAAVMSCTKNVRLQTSALGPRRGAYSRLLEAGAFIFLSGQLPLDPSTGLMAGEDIESQTRQAVANVDRLLRSANASLANIVSVTAYLRDISDWESFNATYRSLMPAPLPARTTVGVGSIARALSVS